MGAGGIKPSEKMEGENEKRLSLSFSVRKKIGEEKKKYFFFWPTLCSLW